jgi:hypothetical protein
VRSRRGVGSTSGDFGGVVTATEVRNPQP